jgi:hypothetical protein
VLALCVVVRQCEYIYNRQYTSNAVAGFREICVRSKEAKEKESQKTKKERKNKQRWKYYANEHVRPTQPH